jgi:alpha-aminoadipate carrier protein LysW
MALRCRGHAFRGPPRGDAQEVTAMSRCPECEMDLELDGYDLDVGETINCPECSAELRVTNTDPIAVTLAETEE